MRPIVNVSIYDIIEKESNLLNSKNNIQYTILSVCNETWYSYFVHYCCVSHVRPFLLFVQYPDVFLNRSSFRPLPCNIHGLIILPYNLIAHRDTRNLLYLVGVILRGLKVAQLDNGSIEAILH